MKHIFKSLLMLCALFTATGAWAINENYINKVGNWSNQGNNYNAGGITLRERYWDSHHGANVTVMDQTISGLPAGHYTVELYANASLANIGAASGGDNGTLNRVFVFANNTELTIPIIHQSQVAKPTLWVIDAEVGNEGTLNLGIKAKENGANWYLIGVKSIKYRGTNAVDKTSNSGTWWSKQSGNTPGRYTSHQGAMKENYNGNYQTGKQLYQTLTGLTPGYYHVGVYASASWTGSRDTGLGSQPGGNNAMDRTYVYAGGNNVKEYIPVISQTGVSVPGSYDLYNVKVGEDGTMEIGIYNEQEGSNWQILSVKDIQYLGTKPDYSHLLGCTQADWDGATGTCDRFTPFRMAEHYEGTQVTGSALLSKTISDLPVGFYTLKLYCNANRANGVGDALSEEGVENTAVVVSAAGNSITNMVKVYTNNSVEESQLLTFEDIEVDDAGTISIAVGNAVAGANWFTIAGESLVWTGVSLNLLKTSLQNAVDAASLRTGEFMSSATLTTLNTAISAAETVLANEDATEEQLNTALTNLQTAVAAIDTWTENWAASKAPLIAAMERFEADYNDGANGALRPMSTAAWNTLVTAAGVAASAKDQYEELAVLGTAAATFNAAMDAAEPSIALYNKYVLLMEALNRYNATQFPKATYDTDANKVSDATITAAIAAMNTAWESFKATLEDNQDVTAMAGENMSFDETQGENLNGNAYKQPEWDVTYVYAGTDGNKQYETMTTESDDLPEGATGNALHMRDRWAGGSGKMQITKTLALPAGNFELSAWMKVLKSTDGNLCYYEVDGTRYNLLPSNIGSWGKVQKEITLETPAVVTISFGVSGGKDMDVYVDDIQLTLYGQTAYERAHEAVEALKNGNSIAIASALDQFPETQAEAEAEGIDVEKAVAVMNNAVAMANANDAATGLLANADFTGGTNSANVPANSGSINYPSGWTFTSNFEGWRDCKVNGGVFNMWAGNIKESELSQVMNNLPNGIYEISGEFKCDILGGKSGIGIFADQLGSTTGRSIDVGTNSKNADEFVTYSAIVEVKDNKMRVGVNSRGGYYQLKNFQVKMLAAAENDATKAGIANSRLYQELAFNRNALEYNLTDEAHANVSGANPQPMLSPNSLITANEGQVVNNTNVIINGTCANLVLTDKVPFKTTTDFTATSATYERDMANTWGTVMLPYAVSSNDDVQFYTLKKVVTGEDGYMSFAEVATLEANTPGVFVKKNESSESVTLSGSNVNVAASTNIEPVDCTGDATGWKLNGLFEQYVFDDVKTDNANEYYYISGDKFWHATGKLTISPFRAYFTTQKNAPAAVKAFRLVIDDRATAIDTVKQPTDGKQTIYTLSGVRLNNTLETLKPGIYIINNKKTIVK